MSLIKITDKHSNLRLKFEHPIVLNPEKKYKLGVSHLMFSLERKLFLGLTFEFYVPIPQEGGTFSVSSSFSGPHTIKSLRKAFQDSFNRGLNGLIEHHKINKKSDIVQKLKKVKITPVKFALTKVNDGEYVVVLNLPFKIKFLTIDGDFCKFFKFEKCIQPNALLAPNIDYTSDNIRETVSPLSVIEWHCNITEYSYTNHNDHPHLHKHNELLHISFVDNNFYDTPVYKEISKEVMFIPLRKGLREIREIVLTPLDEKGNDIKDLKDVAVYLQLKEE
jgi:hypothetical protein